MDSLECFETFERLLRREAARVLERCSGDLSLLRPRHSNKECSLSASADAFERPASTFIRAARDEPFLVP
jgi:hypothetical protein